MLRDSETPRLCPQGTTWLQPICWQCCCQLGEPCSSRSSESELLCASVLWVLCLTWSRHSAREERLLCTGVSDHSGCPVRAQGQQHRATGAAELLSSQAGEGGLQSLHTEIGLSLLKRPNTNTIFCSWGLTKSHLSAGHPIQQMMPRFLLKTEQIYCLGSPAK